MGQSQSKLAVCPSEHVQGLHHGPQFDQPEEFLGRREKDNYTEPLNAPFDWWRGVMAQKMLYLAGEDEIMIDSQRLFGERLAVSLFPLSWSR